MVIRKINQAKNSAFRDQVAKAGAYLLELDHLPQNNSIEYDLLVLMFNQVKQSDNRTIIIFDDFMGELADNTFAAMCLRGWSHHYRIQSYFLNQIIFTDRLLRLQATYAVAFTQPGDMSTFKVYLGKIHAHNPFLSALVQRQWERVVGRRFGCFIVDLRAGERGKDDESTCYLSKEQIDNLMSQAPTPDLKQDLWEMIHSEEVLKYRDTSLDNPDGLFLERCLVYADKEKPGKKIPFFFSLPKPPAAWMKERIPNTPNAIKATRHPLKPTEDFNDSFKEILQEDRADPSLSKIPEEIIAMFFKLIPKFSSILHQTQSPAGKKRKSSDSQPHPKRHH